MENVGGKAGLMLLAGVVTWRSMNPSAKRGVWRFLDLVAEGLARSAAAEQMRRDQERLLAAEGKFATVGALERGIAPPGKSEKPEPDRVQRLIDKLSVVGTPAQEIDAKWRDVVQSPSVVLIVGKRGSGKSALGYRLLELFRYRASPYLVGAPDQARKLLPEWIGLAPTLEELPLKSVALVDEAYVRYHSRRSMADGSIAMSQMLNLSRQRDQTLIFVSQEARQVDRNVASSANVVVFKDLGILQLEFERKELRKIANDAREALATAQGNRQRWSYAYSPDADFLGLIENELPSFWKPQLSRIYAVEVQPAKHRQGARPGPKERARHATEMHRRGASYGEIAKTLGVSKGTVVNYLKDYPYRGKSTE